MSEAALTERPARRLRPSAQVEPTERALWALVVVGGVGLVSAALVSLDAAAPLALGGLMVASALDFVLARSPSSVEVQRRLTGSWHQGEPTSVGWALRAPVPVKVTLTDTLPDGSGPRLVERTVTVSPGEEVRFSAEAVHYERGTWAFGRVALRTHGPLGLVRRRERRVLDDEIVVTPNLSRIGAKAQRLLRGQDAEGARRRKVRQEGREFESLREYVRGDDLRLIAWKASARAGQLIVKRMQPETRQDVVVLLDTGRQLLGAHDEVDGGEPRLDVALASALTLAAAGLLRGDRVGFLPFAGDVRGWVAPEGGSGHLGKIGAAVGRVEALPEEADYGAAVRFLLTRQKRRALVAIVTDVVDEPSARALAAAVTRLRGRHLPLVIALGDPGASRLARADDDEAGSEPLVQQAARRLLDHRRRALAAVAAAGATVVDAPSPRAPALSVQAYAGLKTAGRL